ncbi:MAG TPA: serine/threonine-protein kinase [Pirellulales bacterium]|jgi:serine/threonine-protein kinase|nr:serine/threonine-protein kinase [Pirellulales bacterium]
METIDVGQQACRQFEADWRRGAARPLEEYLPPEGDPWRAAAIASLVEAELHLLAEQSDSADANLPELLRQRVEQFSELNRRPTVLHLLRTIYQARTQAGKSTGLRQYISQFPQWEFREAEIIDAHATEAFAGADTITDAPVPAGTRSPRYTVGRLHAQGGLGQVWVAHDRDLHRDVALKQLQPRWADHGDARQRFLKEAQITGQLEHPNIVPVYELGHTTDDGTPFYTMRFVRGRTLSAAIVEYHQHCRAGVANPLERQNLLQTFIAVGNALAYAHARGVVHRDLKPENVVLGEFGEVLVLDWGLAKVREEPDVLAEVTVGDEAAQQMTQAGHVLGTPAYMAPEQARGRIDQIDARTDIYGLGSILFELLTDRPPHQGATTQEVLESILSGPMPRARAAEPTVPPALDAICAHSMAPERSDRYPSAAELVGDVQRWLADEPISVYREPLPARMARWVRKHRSSALAAAAALVLITVVSVVALIVVRQQQQVAEMAREHEAEQRHRAEAGLISAQDTVDRILARVSSERLAPLAKNDLMRREMLDVAMMFCQQLLTENPTDPGVRWRTGRAHRQVAGIYQVFDQPQDAEKEYALAIEMLEPLAGEFPAKLDYQRDLGGSHNNYGNLLEALGRTADAESAFRKAIAGFERIAGLDPGEADYRLQAAIAHNNLGNLLQATRRFDEAEAEQRAALTLQEMLARTSPPIREYRQSLAATHNNLGILYRATGRVADAEQAYADALRLFSQISGEMPENPEYALQVAMAANNLAAAQAAQGKQAPAEKSYTEAAERFEKLVAEFPTMHDYRFKLAACLTNEALFLAAIGKPAQAQAALTSALQWYDKPGPQAPMADRAITLYTLGTLELDAGHLDEAARRLDQSIELRRSLFRDNPQSVGTRMGLALSLQSAGELSLKKGNLPAAKRLFQEAIETQQPVAAMASASWSARALRRNLCFALVDIDLRLGEGKEATAKAMTLSQALVDPPAEAIRTAELLAQCIQQAAAANVEGFDREEVGRRAFELLRKAGADRKTLASPSLTPLNDLPEFQKLRQDHESTKQ